MKIREKLAARDLANTDWQRDLSFSHNKIGDVQRARGDLNTALLFYREGLEIAEKLAARDPANMTLQQHLADTYEGIGRTLLAHGELVAALNSSEKCWGIWRAAAPPTHQIGTSAAWPVGTLILLRFAWGR